MFEEKGLGQHFKNSKVRAKEDTLRRKGVARVHRCTHMWRSGIMSKGTVELEGFFRNTTEGKLLNSAFALWLHDHIPLDTWEKPASVSGQSGSEDGVK